MSKDSQTIPKEDKRPQIHVHALTANACEVLICMNEGIVRLVCHHGDVLVNANGTNIRVDP